MSTDRMHYADEPVVRLRALRSVTLGVPDPVASKDFYNEAWGLGLSDADTDRFWLRGTGEEHHVLELQKAEQNSLGGVSFAVATRREIDDAARRLTDLGIPLLREPGPYDDAAGGYGLALVDPEGRVVELAADVHAVVRQDQGGYAALPKKLAHVVLNTVDIDRATAFYSQVLGMRVSDWSEHQMSFLRCNPEHHVIAFNQAPWTSVNHVAYEMASVDHFMRGIGSLKVHGVTPQWGPGRHGPGDNTFSYYTDPAQLVCEYTSEVIQVDEDSWLCRTWRRTPELSDQWRTAGPPSTSVRSAMAGIPDAGARARVDAKPDYFLPVAEDNGAGLGVGVEA
ncbi:VOC family protein [Blastococcus sp. URHD0036]|uniref:VOC family protein n=1 Tax=Blastococcus sp. URHD0036 TaxID=1380356 RepID=UPI000B081659|nr:VOC family protein [Blastococcus sp. URHD0036]